MVTSNRSIINDIDTYVLCHHGKYEDSLKLKFFAIMLDTSNTSQRYRFKSAEKNCSKPYPESNEIKHKSKYFRPCFRKQNIS